MGDDDFLQEAFVGYKYGTFSKFGLVCERLPPSAYGPGENGDSMEVDEGSAVAMVQKDDLSKFNMDSLLARAKS